MILTSESGDKVSNIRLKINGNVFSIFPKKIKANGIFIFTAAAGHIEYTV